MFGPNKLFNDIVNTTYCHRDPEFFDSYRFLVEAFNKKFNVRDYDILFIPGSGTIGIEALMFSLKKQITSVGTRGVFQQRWDKKSDYYNKNKKESSSYKIYCQLETSLSEVNSLNGEMVDSISAFPYYDLPAGCKFFVTCSNKILGSYVGLSIVGVRKDCWHDLIDSSVHSYLNLSRYREMGEMNQTPTTAPTHLYTHLGQVVESLDIKKLRSSIDEVSEMLVSAFGPENIIGELRCPVITVNRNIIPDELARKFDLYGFHTGKSTYQFFTYSHDIKDYQDFISEYRKFSNRGLYDYKKSA